MLIRDELRYSNLIEAHEMHSVALCLTETNKQRRKRVCFFGNDSEERSDSSRWQTAAQWPTGIKTPVRSSAPQ